MTSSADEPSPDRRKLDQGRKFENLAAEFYLQQGFEIRERNWRSGHKELDIIVARDNLIVFVEVKSTFSKKFGHPVERLDRKKTRNLIEAANRYIVDHDITDTDLRFDVVTFVNGKLEHFPDAFPAE
jgi:putative endonuclease